MSGHVFHPGHEALHGITVVLFTSGPRTFVGRYDHAEGGFILIHAADFHEADAGGKTQEVYLAEVRKYGVPPKYPSLTVPEKDVVRIVPLGDLPMA